MIEDGDKIVHINVQLQYKNKSLKVVVSIFGTKLILGISMEKNINHFSCKVYLSPDDVQSSNIFQNIFK